jgi:hypothetical protein
MTGEASCRMGSCSQGTGTRCDMPPKWRNQPTCPDHPPSAVRRPFDISTIAIISSSTPSPSTQASHRCGGRGPRQKEEVIVQHLLPAEPHGLPGIGAIDCLFPFASFGSHRSLSMMRRLVFIFF